MSLVYTNKPGKRGPFCLYKTVTYKGLTAQSRKFDTDGEDDDDNDNDNDNDNDKNKNKNKKQKQSAAF